MRYTFPKSHMKAFFTSSVNCFAHRFFLYLLFRFYFCTKVTCAHSCEDFQLFRHRVGLALAVDAFSLPARLSGALVPNKSQSMMATVPPAACLTHIAHAVASEHLTLAQATHCRPASRQCPPPCLPQCCLGPAPAHADECTSSLACLLAFSSSSS